MEEHDGDGRLANTVGGESAASLLLRLRHEAAGRHAHVAPVPLLHQLCRDDPRRPCRLAEVNGPTAVGKTALLYTIAAHWSLPSPFGGCDGRAVLLVADASFDIIRLHNVVRSQCCGNVPSAQVDSVVERCLRRMTVVRVRHRSELLHSLQHIDDMVTASDTTCHFMLCIDAIATTKNDTDAPVGDLTAQSVAWEKALVQRLRTFFYEHRMHCVISRLALQKIPQPGDDPYNKTYQSPMGLYWSKFIGGHNAIDMRPAEHTARDDAQVATLTNASSGRSAAVAIAPGGAQPLA